MTFLAEPSQRRLRTLFELGPKRRKDIQALLNHSVRLDDRYCRHLTGSEAWTGAIERQLRSLGAPNTCFVISADETLDGKEMVLGDALDAVFGSDLGGFVSCIPGTTGLFRI